MALLFDSWLTELVAVLATLFAGFYLYCLIQYQYWKRHGFPYLKPSFPFGNVADMALVRKPIGEVFAGLYERSKDLKFVGIYQFWNPTLIMKDPELIKTILVKDFSYFHDHGSYMDEKNDPLSAQLFSMEGIKWKHMRYKLSPTFTSGKLKTMFPAMVESGKKMQQYLLSVATSEQDNTNMKDHVMKYSTDVIATCVFGIESNVFQNTDSEFVKMGRTLFTPSLMGIIRNGLTFVFPAIGAIVKIPTFRKDVADFFRGVVMETLSYRETNNVTRPDFMQLLIKMRKKKPAAAESEGALETNYYDIHGMTIDELTAQAVGFFVGGMDTSATVIGFCLHELAVNQEIQERLHKEIVSVVDGQLTYEGVVGMSYLDNIVSEALRKYPPAPFLLRICDKDYKVPDSDLVIKRGTRLVIPITALHHDARHFPRPEKFDPDRFTEEAKSQRHSHVYLPFGEGPRICIASRFALLQVKVGLVSLVAKYQFHLCEKTSVPLKISPKSLLTTAEGGVLLKLSPRI